MKTAPIARRRSSTVIPAKAGIHFDFRFSLEAKDENGFRPSPE
jgi:hypothetical protein